MILFKMAFRNIFRHKRRSLFTGLLMAGAYVLFSVSLGVTEGSYSQIIEIYTRSHTGHIQVHRKGYLDRPSIYDSFKDYSKIGEKIGRIKDVESWAPRVYAPALAFVGKKTTGVRIIGIDPEKESHTTHIKKELKEGAYLSERPSGEIMISEGLSRILHAGLHDTVALIGQGTDGSIANDLFTVTGILEGEDRLSCYMHISSAQRFLSMGDRAHEIAVTLKHYSQAEHVTAIIEKTLGNDELDVVPWQEVEKQFYRAMQMDKQGNWITQFIIMLIVAIGILNTVLMTLLERTREFGILRSVGTRPYQIFTLILLETGFLSVFSILIGGIFSLLFNYLLSIHGIKLPTPIKLEGLRFESYVSEITVETILLPAIVTFCVALVVSAFPAIRAARITPVKALRTE
jgi:putative ABC transport system permease protein